jgi:type IV pilus assembly protein PilM
MASARFAWGIDVGNRALKAVKLVRDGDQLKVDDFELIEHEHVLSNAGDNKESLIQTALANFVQRHPMKGGVVAVGVAGQSSFARFIKLPPVEEKKIPEIVRFEAIQQIPFPLDEVEWNYQLFRNPESPDVEVGIFAMRKELIARHIQYFTDFDMNVQVVQMNPLAVYNAMYYDQRLKGTTMVIDLGAENTDLIICDNDTIWMRSIPIGGNNFTETLVKGFKLPFAKAEDLKRNAATSKYARQIFQAMRPVFADLVAEIQRSVGFYASVHRDSRIKRIIALGGTFRLPGLQKYLQQNLSLDVERLDNLAAGAPSDPKLAATFNENLLSVVGAYGLAVQAMNEGKITSSLLPASIRREKLWKEKTPIFASAAACFLIGSGLALVGYFLQNFKYQGNASLRQANSQVENHAKQLDAQWDSDVQNAGATDRELMKNVLGFLQYRDLWRNLLHDIEGAIPKPSAALQEALHKNDAETVKATPRKQRQQVVIDSINSAYHPSLQPYLTSSENDFRNLYSELANAQMTSVENLVMNPGMPQPGAEGQPAAGGEGPRGFLVLIRGTTPSGNAESLIEKNFAGALKAIAPTTKNPKMEYKVERAVTVWIKPVRDDSTRLQQMKQQFDIAVAAQQKAAQGVGASGSGFGGFTGGGGGGENEGAPRWGSGGPMGGMPGGMPGGMAMGGGGTVNPEEDPTPYKDRLTGEDMRDDYTFAVLLAVSLDPPPPAPPGQAPQASAAQP